MECHIAPSPSLKAYQAVRGKANHIGPAVAHTNLNNLYKDVVQRWSPISIATGKSVFVEENLCGSPEAEACAGTVVE